MANITKRFLFAVLLLLCVVTIQRPAHAQNIKVAIAANLQPVMKVLQQDFKRRTGITIDAISGPSGNLTAQIKNGAPFDIFLSADTAFPETLYKSGLAVKSPVVYVQGVLILCSNQKLDKQSWQKIVTSGKVEKVAIGNPAIAPYGKAAEEALKHEGIYEQVKPKLVTGESIAQVNTYIATGVVQAGFTTLSFAKEQGEKLPISYRLIDQKTYSPIKQGMVLLKRAQTNAGANRFYQYLLSADAKKIFLKYGYHVQ